MLRLPESRKTVGNVTQVQTEALAIEAAASPRDVAQQITNSTLRKSCSGGRTTNKEQSARAAANSATNHVYGDQARPCTFEKISKRFICSWNKNPVPNVGLYEGCP